MFPMEESAQHEISKTIEAIKALNFEKKKVLSSADFRLGRSIHEKQRELKRSGIKGFYRIVTNYVHFQRTKNFSMAPFIPATREYGVSNYFIDADIAVYTCITGGYDRLLEPIFAPNNCHFFAVTDFEIPSNSHWKRINAESFIPKDKSYSSAEINRYFKMHPEVLFPQFDYSVYVDGNIRICTDVSEYVNRISEYGIGFFRHSQRNDVYEEAKACVAVGKAPADIVEKQVTHMQEAGFPASYGMAQCSVIARRHNDLICQKIMNQWWDEFQAYAKRDQLSLPFVLFQNGIQVKDVVTLGTNVYSNDSFEIVVHK